MQAAETASAALGETSAFVLDGTTSLIDKNLLLQMEQEGEPRLLMLETIREYGVEALITNEEWEAALCAHAHYYLALAEQAEGELIGPQQVAWLGRLEQEHDNLRAVFNWALSPGSAEGGNKHRRALGLCLGGVLHEFWINHQHFDEGRALLERLITASNGVATVQRAKALNVAADLAYIQRDLQRTEELAQEALGLCRELGDRAGRAFSLTVLGNVASLIGEHTKAHALLEEGIVLYRELDNKHRLGWSLYALGGAAFRRGDSAEAYAWYEEALMWFRELGNKPGIAGVLAHWAHALVLYQGDSQTARALINEAIPLMRELGNTWWLALPFWLLGELALSQDDAVTAHSFAEEALVLDRESNRKSSIAMALSFLARVELHQGNDAAARSLFEESLTLSREIDDKDTLTFSLEGLAGVVAKQGAVIWAARLWGAAEALREAIHAPHVSDLSCRL